MSRVMEDMRKETAVLALIDGYRDIGMNEAEIKQRIMDKFHLTKTETQAYMDLSFETA